MSTEFVNSNDKFVRTESKVARNMEEENDSQEGKVKTKLKSMWNNMKYGKLYVPCSINNVYDAVACTKS
jgi:hypothetical protein